MAAAAGPVCRQDYRSGWATGWPTDVRDTYRGSRRDRPLTRCGSTSGTVVLPECSRAQQSVPVRQLSCRGCGWENTPARTNRARARARANPTHVSSHTAPGPPPPHHRSGPVMRCMGLTGIEHERNLWGWDNILSCPSVTHPSHHCPGAHTAHRWVHRERRPLPPARTARWQPTGTAGARQPANCSREVAGRAGTGNAQVNLI